MIKTKFCVFHNTRDVPRRAANLGVLQYDNWNDFGYRTSFGLSVFDGAGVLHEIGLIKIGSSGMTSDRSVQMPVGSFEALGKEYFSLGGGTEFYEKIRNLDVELREQLLVALKDMAYNLETFHKYREEDVTKVSLLRGIGAMTTTPRQHGRCSGPTASSRECGRRVGRSPTSGRKPTAFIPTRIWPIWHWFPNALVRSRTRQAPSRSFCGGTLGRFTNGNRTRRLLLKNQPAMKP